MNVDREASSFEKVLAVIVLVILAWIVLSLLGFLARIVGHLLSWAFGILIWVLIGYGAWYLLVGRKRRV
jgi:hypothetical protein